MSPTFHDDVELLRRFQAERTSEAFGALVARHVPLVWSTARRVLVSCPALVEDVAQMVFADFARRADTLRADQPAGGWLHRHTWFTATTVLRAELRRRQRETTAAMNAEFSDASLPVDDAWAHLAPHLDEALASLSAPDREAVVLRFFEQWDFPSIGAALRLSDEAARKRVTRALEKLRRRLHRQGVTLGAAALGVLLGGHAVARPPAGLATRVAAHAWSRATVTAGGVSLLAKLWLAVKSAPLAASVATVVALTGALWWWSSRAVPPVAARTVADAPAPPPAPVIPGEPLRVRLDVFNVENTLATRLLAAGQSAAALFEQLDAAAAPPPDLHQTTEVEAELSLSPVFRAAVFDGPAETGRALVMHEMVPFEYATEFEIHGLEEPVAVTKETRNVGTEVRLMARRAAAKDFMQAEVQLTHHCATPEWQHWPLQVGEEGGRSEAAVAQPEFCVVQGSAASEAPVGDPCLVMAMKTPPAARVPGSAARPPRRVLVFLRIDSVAPSHPR